MKALMWSFVMIRPFARPITMPTPITATIASGMRETSPSMTTDASTAVTDTW